MEHTAANTKPIGWNGLPSRTFAPDDRILQTAVLVFNLLLVMLSRLSYFVMGLTKSVAIGTSTVGRS